MSAFTKQCFIVITCPSYHWGGVKAFHCVSHENVLYLVYSATFAHCFLHLLPHFMFVED